MTTIDADNFAAQGVPDLHSIIPATRGDDCSIRCPGECEDIIAVAAVDQCSFGPSVSRLMP